MYIYIDIYICVEHASTWDLEDEKMSPFVPHRWAMGPTPALCQMELGSGGGFPEGDGAIALPSVKAMPKADIVHLHTERTHT
jgi:hypothetical protein